MRVNNFLNPWVSEFNAGLFVWMCPVGLGLTKAKKGVRNVEVCLLVKHTHTHINIKDFLYYCSPLTILEFLNFFWGKRGFWNHKVFWKKWILQKHTFFPFSPPRHSTDNVLCSIPNANYNKWWYTFRRNLLWVSSFCGKQRGGWRARAKCVRMWCTIFTRASCYF